jgi:hypothetical protein
MLNIAFLLMFSIFFQSCTLFAPKPAKQTLSLKGPAGLGAFLFRKQSLHNTSHSLIPKNRVKAQETVELEVGRYLLVEDCSKMEFDLTPHSPLEIHLSQLQLHLSHSTSESLDSTANEEETVSQSLLPPQAAGVKALVRCEDPIDEHPLQFTHRTQFTLLPGTTQIQVSGHMSTFTADAHRSSLVEEHLTPVRFRIPEGTTSHTTVYFSQWNPTSKAVESSPPNTESHSPSSEEMELFSVNTNDVLWLREGQYYLELNGSSSKISITKGHPEVIELGAFTVHMPKGFPMELRKKLGGGPVFINSAQGALFDLDKVHLLFPGVYRLFLENSDISTTAEVKTGEWAQLETTGMLVAPPQDPSIAENPNIKITIHKKGNSYAAHTVLAGMPFLVFDSDYQVGVEGVRGVNRDIDAKLGSWKQVQLGRLKLNWEQLVSARGKTDLVRVEAASPESGAINGKSLDLLFGKAQEVYLPEGEYRLTSYFQDFSGDRSKTSQSFQISAHRTAELRLPVYIDKPLLSASQEKPAPAPSQNQGLPTQLSPLGSQ